MCVRLFVCVCVIGRCVFVSSCKDPSVCVSWCSHISIICTIQNNVVNYIVYLWPVSLNGKQKQATCLKMNRKKTFVMR